MPYEKLATQEAVMENVGPLSSFISCWVVIFHQGAGIGRENGVVYSQRYRIR